MKVDSATPANSVTGSRAGKLVTERVLAMIKLSLRELFLVVTLAAVLVAWWLEHAKQAASRAELETKLAATGWELASTKVQATSTATRLMTRYLDACRACAAHGLYVQGSGQYARLVENNGEDFKRSTRAAPYVLIDGNP